MINIQLILIPPVVKLIEIFRPVLPVDMVQCCVVRVYIYIYRASYTFLRNVKKNGDTFFDFIVFLYLGKRPN